MPPRRVRPFDVEHECGQRDEHECEHRCGRSVEERPVLDVDRPSQRLVAHEGHDAEVRQGVERHEQRSRADRRPESGERHAHERVQTRAPEPASGLLERGVEPAERGRGEQEDERVRREGERRERAPEAVDLRQALDAEDLLEQALRPERAEQAERGDVARDHERQGRRHRPEAAAREVGARHEPGEGHADGDRRGRDREDERPGLEHELDGALAAEDAPALPAAARRPHDEVGERQQQERDDEPRREGEEERGPAPPAPRRHDV